MIKYSCEQCIIPPPDTSLQMDGNKSKESMLQKMNEIVLKKTSKKALFFNKSEAK
jgi:hypothetical protein